MKNVGRLVHQVALTSPLQVNNGGELSTTWEDEGSEWAEVITSHGTEALEAARSNAKEIIRVRIHYRDDLNTTWRMLWNGQYYYIQSVDRSGVRNGELWFTAQAQGAL